MILNGSCNKKLICFIFEFYVNEMLKMKRNINGNNYLMVVILLR
ncbi:hypothetical protein T03_8159 [Trichinella britovi]|uniref:Uncharacterized protein n=1 Tax=Trichinella britovi TaxID=45882 RepID=A0A0V0YSU0_TRIBR|nr:hypothetical protein T03_8159 [Trichinella britovi]